MITPYFFEGMLTPGMGKERNVRNWLSHKPSGIVYVISREEIDNSNVCKLLEFFGPHIGHESLLRLRGQVHFAIAGYDSEPKEIYEIPAVKKFLLAIHALWPAWIYVASPASPCLLAIAFGICKTRVTREDDFMSVKVEYKDKKAFFDSSKSAAVLLNYITGVEDENGIQQIQTIAKYLEVEV